MSLASHKGKNNFELGNKSYTSRGGDTPIYDITSSSGGGGGERTKALINLQDLWIAAGQNWITNNNNGNYNTLDVTQLINSLSNTPPPERRDQADATYPGYDNNWYLPGDGSFVHAASDIWIIRSIEFNMISEKQGSLGSISSEVRRTFETYVHDTVDIVSQDQLNHTRNGRWTHIGDGYGARRYGDKLHLLSGTYEPFLKYFFLEIRGSTASTGGSGEGGLIKTQFTLPTSTSVLNNKYYEFDSPLPLQGLLGNLCIRGTEYTGVYTTRGDVGTGPVDHDWDDSRGFGGGDIPEWDDTYASKSASGLINENLGFKMFTKWQQATLSSTAGYTAVYKLFRVTPTNKLRIQFASDTGASPSDQPGGANVIWLGIPCVLYGF